MITLYIKKYRSNGTNITDDSCSVHKRDGYRQLNVRQLGS